MPPKLRVLSGQDLIRELGKHGFSITSQRGSHVKLKRVTASATQILVVPNHKSIREGTLQSLYQKASAYLPEDVLAAIFYTET